MKYLLDTNAISEVIKPQPNAGFETWMDETDEESLYLSVLTVGELRRGIDRLPEGSRRRKLEAWLIADLLPRFETRILVVTQEIADLWGRLLAQTENRGRRMGLIDAMFAATAILNGMTLVSRNTRDFSEAGVAVLCPWEK